MKTFKDGKTFSILLSIFLTIILSSAINTARADVIGSITTDRDLYDVNATIVITYNLSSDGTGNPSYTDVNVVGYLPTYNSTTMSQETYMGSRILEGAGNEIFFKRIKRFVLEDGKETNSSFIPIPPIRGTVNAFVRPAIAGEYPDFLGKVQVRSTSPGVSKDIHITREQPAIMLTNITMKFQDAYTTADTLVLSYFCKNNCSIIAIDEANPLTPYKVFQYGISNVTGKTLTTSDTNEWKQIVIPLANSGYTPDDDFIRITITDIKGNSDFATFFVYQPTADVIRLNKNVIFNIGSNYRNIIPFNNSMGLVYRTPDVTSEYRIMTIVNIFLSPSKCDKLTYSILPYPVNGVVAPNNGIKFISLQDGLIYDAFQSRLSCMPSSTTNLTLNLDFKLQEKARFLYIFPYWNTIGTTTGTIKADRIDMNLKTSSLVKISEEGKTSFDLKSLSDMIGLSGTLGYLIFALLFLVVTFFAIIRLAKLDAQIAVIFCAFEVWYFVYAGFIDALLLVIIVVVIVLVYVSRILRFFRSEPPTGGTGGTGES